MKFKIGDVVEVVGKTGANNFNVGDKLIVSSPIDRSGYYKCYYLDFSDWWRVKECDLKPIQEAAPTKDELLNAGFEKFGHGHLRIKFNCLTIEVNSSISAMWITDNYGKHARLNEIKATKENLSNAHFYITGYPLNFEKKEEKVEWKRGNVLKQNYSELEVVLVNGIDDELKGVILTPVGNDLDNGNPQPVFDVT